MDGKRAGKLLLVEDEDLLRKLIAQFLHGQGYQVIEAADGQQGVELFARLSPFDLVLLDLNLPVLSGVDVCRRIKAEKPDQPVIICSGAILDSHVVALQDLNVHQFLSKPYHPVELANRIVQEISRNRSGDVDPDRRPAEGASWRVDSRECSSHARPYPGQRASVGLR